MLRCARFDAAGLDEFKAVVRLQWELELELTRDWNSEKRRSKDRGFDAKVEIAQATTPMFRFVPVHAVAIGPASVFPKLRRSHLIGWTDFSLGNDQTRHKAW